MLLISIIAGMNISSMFPPHFPAGLIRLQANSGANQIRQKTSHGNQITTMEENYDPLKKSCSSPSLACVHKLPSFELSQTRF